MSRSPAAPFYRFFFFLFFSPGRAPKIDYSKRGTLILTSLLEDLGVSSSHKWNTFFGAFIIWKPKGRPQFLKRYHPQQSWV